jgi:hypothetical protein
VTVLDYVGLRPLTIAADHVFISVVRNEMLRLPYLLQYYRALGFEEFMFVDNGSDDGTREFLVQQPDCFVFTTADSFSESRWGMIWVQFLLDHFCVGKWILLADADEILVWHGSERETIRGLTRRLDASGAEAFFTLLLDMYSDRPFGQIGYRAGEPFVDHCPLFDRGPYHVVQAKLYPYRQLYGGVRARLFQQVQAGFSPPTVSKVPLLRWRKGQEFLLVAHALAMKQPLARMRGALLHFKMFDDLPQKCEVEIRRGEHYAQGREYRALGAAIAQSPTGTFFHPEVSVRYGGTGQLAQLHILSDTKAFGRD